MFMFIYINNVYLYSNTYIYIKYTYIYVYYIHTYGMWLCNEAFFLPHPLLCSYTTSPPNIQIMAMCVHLILSWLLLYASVRNRISANESWIAHSSESVVVYMIVHCVANIFLFLSILSYEKPKYFFELLIIHIIYVYIKSTRS